ncbi:MAG: hypothetical protein IKW45_09240 [Clostridia bacterium]|nr:hypothetical protein [Clostridia bacterium]
MSNYSYSEIQNMQQKAMARVRQMQKNTDAILERANQDFESEKLKPKPQFEQKNTPITPKVTNMPANFPEKSVYPSFKEFFEEDKSKEMPKLPQKESKPQQVRQNTLETLFAEPDKAMLMGLIMLLKSEGADEMLIMALLYILS